MPTIKVLFQDETITGMKDTKKENLLWRLVFIAENSLTQQENTTRLAQSVRMNNIPVMF